MTRNVEILIMNDKECAKCFIFFSEVFSPLDFPTFGAVGDVHRYTPPSSLNRHQDPGLRFPFFRYVIRFAITDFLIIILISSAISLQSFEITEHFLPFQWCNIIRKRCRRSSTNQTKNRWTCSTCPSSPDSLTLIDDWVGRSQVSKEQRYFRSCWRHHTSAFWIPAGILKASSQEQDECWWWWDREQPTHTCCSTSCPKA